MKSKTAPSHCKVDEGGLGVRAAFRSTFRSAWIRRLLRQASIERQLGVTWRILLPSGDFFPSKGSYAVSLNWKISMLRTKISIWGWGICFKSRLVHDSPISISWTKLRVAWDGSAATTSGYLLNCVLMSGPVIQLKLLNILLRFRCNRMAITEDMQNVPMRQSFRRGQLSAVHSLLNST